MYSTELLAQTLISGVMIGILYALMALGITFIYSIVRMINWAMGEFYMLGSYIQYVAVAYLLGRNYWWLAIIISTAGTFLIGYLLEPILIKPMHARAMERRDDYATVVTIALLLMLRSLAVAIGGPYQYRPETNLPIMWVGPLPMEGARVMASVFALVALALFYLVISKTWIGLALRAAAQNRVAAQTSGVDVFRLDAVAFAIGVALAGLAGALLAPLFLVYPTNGAVTTVKGFEIIVIGGLGSIPGALIGGVLLGVVESLGAAFISSPYQNAYGFALVLLVLLVTRHGRRRYADRRAASPVHAGAAGGRSCQVALRRPTHAAASLLRIHDPGCEGARARRAVRRDQSGGEGHADRADPQGKPGRRNLSDRQPRNGHHPPHLP